jgi:hypothetical protein
LIRFAQVRRDLSGGNVSRKPSEDGLNCVRGLVNDLALTQTVKELPPSGQWDSDGLYFVHHATRYNKSSGTEPRFQLLPQSAEYIIGVIALSKIHEGISIY